MKTFNIAPINNTLKTKLQHKIDSKTKPLGALGSLEDMALQIGCVQNTLSPSLTLPSIVVFAGDHGIAKKGEVNPFPQEVTAQMVLNFANKGAAINVFCKTNDLNLIVVDAGVNYDFTNIKGIVDAKIDLGTQNYQKQPAMTIQQCENAVAKGADIINQLHNKGCNTVGFGEMGISNTSSATLIMSYILNIPITECVGAGTGLNPDGIHKKMEILKAVQSKYQIQNSLEALRTFGGYEMAMLCGAILQAAENKMLILVDGFIVTASLLIAHTIDKKVLDYCIFAHTSGEQGHQKMLDYLKVKPLLNIGLRLGEGTGAALAVPLLKASVNFLNEMASFQSAAVSNS